MHCAASGNAEMLQIILDKGPNLDLTDKFGRTALHYACKADNLKTLTILGEQEEIEVNCVTNGGKTPLMMAVEQGDPELVRTCLNMSAAPFIKDVLGQTAKDYCLFFEKDKREEILRQLEMSENQWTS